MVESEEKGLYMKLRDEKINYLRKMSAFKKIILKIKFLLNKINIKPSNNFRVGKTQNH